MDTTSSDISNWFSSTVQNVGTTVANAWANAWAARQGHSANPPTSPPPPPPRTEFSSAALKNPLAWIFLLGIAFVGYKLVRG